MTHQTTKHSY